MVSSTDVNNLIKEGRLDEAMDLVSIELAYNSDDLIFINLQGSIFLRQAKLEAALDSYAHAYNLAPETPAYVATYATVLARNSNFDRALSILKTYESNHEANARIIHAKADIYVRLRNWHMAKFFYDQYRNKFPLSYSVELSYTDLLIRLGEFVLAKTILLSLQADRPGDKKIESMLKAVEIETLRSKNVQHNISQFQILNPKKPNEFIAVGDIALEFGNSKDAVDNYLSGIAKFPKNQSLKIKLIECYLQQGELSKAIELWKKLPKTSQFCLSSLSLERIGQSYVEIDGFSELVSQTKQKILKKFSIDKSIKKIAIVGGSNSIMLKGWAPAFTISMKRLFGVTVDNYGLGGISGLYGLTVIKEKELFNDYDLVIFEYTLNDVYFYNIGAYPLKLIESAISELARTFQGKKSHLLLLELVPSEELSQHLNNESVVPELYKKIAKNYSTLYLSSTDMMKEAGYSLDFCQALYADNMHCTGKFAHKISNHLIKKLSEHSFFKLSKRPLTQALPPFNLTDIRLLKSEALKFTGEVNSVTRETKIIRHAFMKLGRQASVEFTIHKGQFLLGLMINSSVNTGYIKVYFGDYIFIKNIYAQRPNEDPEKPRIFLRQFSEVLFAESDIQVRITANVTEEDLKLLPRHTTAYPAKPQCSLEEQELEMSGILVA